MSERLTNERIEDVARWRGAKTTAFETVDMATEIIVLRAQVAALTENLRNTDAALDATYGAEIRLEEREAEMVVALAQVAALREALATIAAYDLRDDLREVPYVRDGFLAPQYGAACVKTARAALEMSGGVK